VLVLPTADLPAGVRHTRITVSGVSRFVSDARAIDDGAATELILTP
jgi:hypothetical protein